MSKRITEKVTWVGKIDWELKSFHGHELSTYKGSSYNAYLVRGNNKTALIDTVWQPFDKEFVTNLKKEIDLHSIDYIIMNHNEIDHSGSLPELMREIPDTPIYCTAKGEGIIRGHYHKDWNFVNVKTGDTLDLGYVMLTFIEQSMRESALSSPMLRLTETAPHLQSSSRCFRQSARFRCVRT